MESVARLRTRLACWHNYAESVWCDLREDLGRRVAKSKRREIAELQEELRGLRAQQVVLATKLALYESQVAERDAFDRIRRHFGD